MAAERGIEVAQNNLAYVLDQGMWFSRLMTGKLGTDYH